MMKESERQMGQRSIARKEPEAVVNAAEALAPVYVFGLGLETGGIPESRVREHPFVASTDVLVGGRRHLAFFEDHPAEKLVVGADIPALLERLRANREAGLVQTVLCSGDPLYFSLGGRIAEYCRRVWGDAGLAGLRILPGNASVQVAAALLGLPWEGMRSVSLHGRDDWLPLAHALTSGACIFLLTDADASLGAVARFFYERGFDNYRLHVLDNLYINATTGTVHAERQRSISVSEALAFTEEFSGPVQRVIVCEPEEAEEAAFGLPDEAVSRDKNILTKQPARAAGLAALGIAPRHLVWDLGAGSGAVSVEACRLAWQGRVAAVEKNPARVAHIRENRRRFKAANLEIVQADMADALAAALQAQELSGGNAAKQQSGGRGGPDEAHPAGGGFRPDGGRNGGVLYGRPHRICIGGGLASGEAGDAGGILKMAWDLLLPGGRLVAYCVLLGSLELARRTLSALGAQVSVISLQAGKTKPLAGDLHFEGMNPVFLLCAEKACAAGVIHE